MTEQGDTSRTKSGFAAIVGRPNVGKSTLVNALVGEKVSIVSAKPNTTRNRICGVLTRGDAQIVFVDTPGIRETRDMFDARLVKTALQTIRDVNMILFVVEAGAKTFDMEKVIAEKIKRTHAKLFLVINKIDKIEKPELLAEIERRTAELGEFDEIVPVSALNKINIDVIEKLTIASLPDGPHYFPPDAITDQPERFVAAEMVREQLFAETRMEVPYSTAVTVEEWADREKNVYIRARIHVERKSQKAIVIGSKGATLKKIGTAARVEIEKMLGSKVYLELFVDVLPKWRRKETALDTLGYNEDEES